MSLLRSCKHLSPLARLAVFPPAVARLSAVRDFSSRKGGRISETSVFIQTGHKITELPVVVKKVKDVWELYRRMGIDTKVKQPEDQHLLALPKKLSEGEKEIISGFNRCYNSSSIFRLLEPIPSSEVTPQVASQAYKKIVELENTYEARNPNNIENRRSDQPHSFFRSAFISSLLDIICNSKDPGAILEGLTSVMRDQNSDDQDIYKARLLEELLVCVTDGMFPLQDICKAVHILSIFYPDHKKCRQVADKLWFGIIDQSKSMTNEDIVAVFTTLPHLTKSRNMILKVLEEKAGDSWQQFKTGDVVEILRVLQELKYDRISQGFMRMLSGWLAVNIHTVTEQEMLAIVYSFLQLEYMDTALVSALEKIIKKKGCQIMEFDLICTICSYCLAMRIRSPTILEGVGQYFIEHHQSLTVPQVTAIAGIFGHLDFHPANGFKFWELLELVLDLKFSQFPPVDIINLLVSFIYIEKFPINFTNKLFNPFFLDRLHSQSEDLVAISRQQLKLYDTTMKLECRGYEGPFLPKDTNHRMINTDSRIMRTVNKLLDPMADVVGDFSRLGKSVVLSSLPLHPLYIVDLMVYPTHAASLLRFGFQTNNSNNVAVLVLTPEHYDQTGEHLVGSQAMRVRQLTIMGFKVMCVNMQMANKLMMQPKKVREYLQKLYTDACKKKK
eukprot:GFUD01001774.1.p1 GENE.GFUD01001774.1~~GFUD01001774.1.p1  ORF type:complete len:670 (+),score=234.94 GFUD01001774.1:542-2551(+)